jgi:hypothetical protein
VLRTRRFRIRPQGAVSGAPDRRRGALGLSSSELLGGRRRGVGGTRASAGVSLLRYTVKRHQALSPAAYASDVAHDAGLPACRRRLSAPRSGQAHPADPAGSDRACRHHTPRLPMWLGTARSRSCSGRQSSRTTSAASSRPHRARCSGRHDRLVDAGVVADRVPARAERDPVQIDGCLVHAPPKCGSRGRAPRPEAAQSECGFPAGASSDRGRPRRVLMHARGRPTDQEAQMA